MRDDQFIAQGERLGLERIETFGGVAVRGEVRGRAVLAAQIAVPMGPDPRPRPMTELSVEGDGASRGGLCGTSSGSTGATGDRAFDERFIWRGASGGSGRQPGYLASEEFRSALVAFDAEVARAVGHQGMPLLQIDHLAGQTRMMILSHLPQPEQLERALRLLHALALTG